MMKRIFIAIAILVLVAGCKEEKDPYLDNPHPVLDSVGIDPPILVQDPVITDITYN